MGMLATRVVPRATARGHCVSMLAPQRPPLRGGSLALETSSASAFIHFFLRMMARYWNGFDSLVHLLEVKNKTKQNTSGLHNEGPQLKWGRETSCVCCDHSICLLLLIQLGSVCPGSHLAAKLQPLLKAGPGTHLTVFQYNTSLGQLQCSQPGLENHSWLIRRIWSPGNQSSLCSIASSVRGQWPLSRLQHPPRPGGHCPKAGKGNVLPGPLCTGLDERDAGLGHWLVSVAYLFTISDVGILFSFLNRSKQNAIPVNQKETLAVTSWPLWEGAPAVPPLWRAPR